jgi:hypothetical protein
MGWGGGGGKDSGKNSPSGDKGTGVSNGGGKGTGKGSAGGTALGGAAQKSVTKSWGAGGGSDSGASSPSGDQGRGLSRNRKTDSGTSGGKPYTPGAVPNFPEADALTVFEKIFAPLIPGVGSSLGVATVGKLLQGDETTVLGGDPGPQRGWSPDRYRGEDSLGGVGGSGGAVNGGDREIAGRPLGSGNRALTDDQAGDTTGNGTGPGGDFSDVMLKDRRKPYSGLKQMLETML